MLSTLLWVLVPLFVGFFIHVRQPRHLAWVNQALNLLVYIVLGLIGTALAQVENLGQQAAHIVSSAAILFGCIIGCNLLALMLFDRRWPWQQPHQGNHQKARVSLSGSLKQLGCVLLGFSLGMYLPGAWLPPHATGGYAVSLLILLIGIQLRSSGITLRHVLINKRGVQTSLIFMFSALCGGLMAAWWLQWPWSKGLAMAAGFGWYSLSSIIMTDAYGAVEGGIALFNDLAREFFALVFIPLLMRRHPSAAVGSGGATSLDFTLPVIQSAGGLAVVPMAISFGFIVNVVSPILMVLLAHARF